MLDSASRATFDQPALVTGGSVGSTGAVVVVGGVDDVVVVTVVLVLGAVWRVSDDGDVVAGSDPQAAMMATRSIAVIDETARARMVENLRCRHLPIGDGEHPLGDDRLPPLAPSEGGSYVIDSQHPPRRSTMRR